MLLERLVKLMFARDDNKPWAVKPGAQLAAIQQTFDVASFKTNKQTKWLFHLHTLGTGERHRGIFGSNSSCSLLWWASQMGSSTVPHRITNASESFEGMRSGHLWDTETEEAPNLPSFIVRTLEKKAIYGCHGGLTRQVIWREITWSETPVFR